MGKGNARIVNMVSSGSFFGHKKGNKEKSRHGKKKGNMKDNHYKHKKAQFKGSHKFYKKYGHKMVDYFKCKK